MLRRIGRFMELYFGRIEVIVVLSMLCYLIGVLLLLYHWL